MVDTATGAGQRIAADLVLARRRLFVGRDAQLAAFRAALRERAGRVAWHVHGLGGIGKSTLLRRLADEARAAGRSVVEVDLAALTCPGAVADAYRALLRARPDVVLVDSVEQCPPQAADAPDRLARLARLLPEPAIIVLGSRQPAAPSRLPVRPVRLGPWSGDEARDFLSRRGVPAEAHERLLAFADGHPLALSLAATVALRDHASGTWAPTPEVTAALCDRLVPEPPTPAHRQALEVCAHALTTTEDLLRVVIGSQAPDLYQWLRRQPFIEPTPLGLHADDFVRTVVDDDLRWRDPAGYQRIHEQLTGHLLHRAQAAGPEESRHAIRSLWQMTLPAEASSAGPAFRGEPAGDRDRDELLALTEVAEDPATARLVEYWLDRQPGAFQVFRPVGSDRIAAFNVVLSLPADDPMADDPVVAAAWESTTRQAPLRPGERWLVSRFTVPSAADRPAGLSTLIHEHDLQVCVRTERLAWSFIAVAERVDLSRLMGFLDHHPIAPGPVGGHRVYGHDWRTVPAGAWLSRVNASRLYGLGALADEPAPEIAVVSADEFAAAVRELLRGWHRTSGFADSPLLRSRIATDNPANDDPAAALRSAVETAVAKLSADRGGDRLRTVVSTTFFAGLPTQNAVAEHLRMPFSTYRRHLSRGVERVAEILWRWEIRVDEDY
jgi:hypothetical protein